MGCSILLFCYEVFCCEVCVYVLFCNGVWVLLMFVVYIVLLNVVGVLLVCVVGVMVILSDFYACSLRCS